MVRETVRLENVSKRYGTRLAVANVSFSVLEGEIVGLVGPNGAGKTTLMRIIAGLIRNFDGEVWIEGCRARIGRQHTVRRIGCMIESPGFYPFLSGLDNLVFLSAWSGRVSKEQLSDAVERVGLANDVHRKVGHYSMGMRQRLAIALSILHRPSLLLLDEPANGLDPNGVREMRDILRRIVDGQRTAILISSHNLVEIERICNRVVILHRGRVVEILDLDEKRASRHIFVIRTPQAAELAAYLRAAGFHANCSEISSVVVEMDTHRVSELIRVAASSGFDLLGVHEKRETLEERFIEVLGGSGDV